MPYISLIFVVLMMGYSWAVTSVAPRQLLGGGQLDKAEASADAVGATGAAALAAPTGARPPVVNESVHTGLQDDLKKFLYLYTDKFLQGDSVQIQKLNTEYLGRGEIVADFELQYTDARGDQLQHQGRALLQHHEQNVWQLRRLQLHNQAIEMTEEILIKAGP